MSSRFGICFQAVALAIIRPYYWTVYRIRSWGRLPWRRGATLMVCNHQHDLDTVATIVQASNDGPWNKPVYSAGSRRMFEPGFMAIRVPWLRSYLRRFDSTKLFGAMGILPIENELRTRSLASLAWAVYASHGEVPLTKVVSSDVIAQLDPQAASTTVGQLFGERWFKRAQGTRVSVKTVLEPYRSEIYAHTRQHLEPDYQLLESTLRAGTTMFLTPEGRYSQDGRMYPLRSALMRLLPLAHEIYLLAISYDVFVGSRLSCLFRILPLPDRRDLDVWMRATRPITASQLLSAWLFERSLSSFSRIEATEAVASRLQSLPPSAFVDPELRKRPGRVASAALDGLLRLGALEERSGEFALTSKRRHPQFPLVKDMVAYQSRFFGETIDALECLAGTRM
ncbi:MAG: hypothetical protein M3Z41_05660 [Candidatus Eremiobacteraeota bacterium]|nr:hypothetical protein [Candidatus Eremiobacteraeota bacterium]